MGSLKFLLCNDNSTILTFINKLVYLISFAQGYPERDFFEYVYLSLFIITKLFLKPESLILFKFNKLMVVIGNKPAPRRPRIQIEKIDLQVIPCKCPCADFFTVKPFKSGPYSFLENWTIIISMV